METPSYYAIIPANVRYCDEVCPSAKLLYGEITALSNANGYCYAGNRYFADLYKLKRLQTISDWIKQLEKNGFISVELTYKGKEIDQRIIRLTPNEKTLDVQRKNDIGTTEKRCTPTTKKRCDNNTSINNTSNNTSNRVVGDFQSPAAPQKTGDEKAEFSEWLHNNGFTRLSKTNFFLEKEKSCAKKEKHGEAGYLATLGAIDTYLGESPKYLADKKDFARVFDKFAVSTDFITAKNDLNRVFSKKFKTPYTLRGKAADTGLNGVISQLDALGGEMTLQQKITGFFDALATLPKFDNPTAWKPAFINADFSEIIALLKNNKASQPSRGETYKERDARLAQGKRDAEKAALKESAAYDAMRAQIIRILDNGGELQPFHKESQPYKDMFGGDQTPF
jgi:hypothetical protein